MTKAKLVILRHGETEYNKKDLLTGKHDPQLTETGKLQADLGLPPLDPENDRIMLCGSPALLKDMQEMLEIRGFKEGSTTTPGDYVIERAFVEK